MNPMIIAAMVAVVGGVAGGWLRSSGNAKERKAREEALEQYAALQPPKVQQMIAREISESRMSEVSTDEADNAAQDEARERLLDRGRNGPGIALRAAQEQARMNAARTAQGDREAVLASARARGTAGSGEEILLQQDANQAAAETERMAGLQALAAEDEAALQSLIAGGNLAAQQQAGDFARKSAVAGAEDDIAMFNAGQYNQFQLENQRVRQQDFENRLRLTDRRTEALLGIGMLDRRQKEDEARAVGAATQSASSGIAGMGGGGAGGAAGAGAMGGGMGMGFGKTAAPQQAKVQQPAPVAKGYSPYYQPQQKRRLV